MRVPSPLLPPPILTNFCCCLCSCW
jgi:hypothetical protein